MAMTVPNRSDASDFCDGAGKKRREAARSERGPDGT